MLAVSRRMGPCAGLRVFTAQEVKKECASETRRTIRPSLVVNRLLRFSAAPQEAAQERSWRSVGSDCQGCYFPKTFEAASATWASSTTGCTSSCTSVLHLLFLCRHMDDFFVDAVPVDQALEIFCFERILMGRFLPGRT